MQFLHDMGEGEEEEDEEEDVPPSYSCCREWPGGVGRPCAGGSCRRAGGWPRPLKARSRPVGSIPATAESLQAELRVFRPDQEVVGGYLTRIARVALALRVHGVAVSPSELEISARSVATVARPEWPTACGPDFRSQRLRKEMNDGDAADIQKKIQAIGVLILALGGRQSASADKIRNKVWSFISDVLRGRRAPSRRRSGLRRRRLPAVPPRRLLKRQR